MTTIWSKKKRRVPPPAFFYVVLLAVLLGGAGISRDAIGNLLWQALSPVFAVRDAGAGVTEGFFAQFISQAELAAENRRLKDALASTSALALDREFLRRENLDLKWRLGRTVSERVILTSVIQRPPGIPYDTLMIGVGRSEGVRDGDLVSAGGAAFIGYVSTTYEHSSRVVLFSSPGEVREGLVRGTIPLSIEGQGAGSLMGELPANTEVAVGDPVLIPNIMPQFMAEISAIIRREGESFQSIYLTLPANPFSLRFVEVHSAPEL